MSTATESSTAATPLPVSKAKRADAQRNHDALLEAAAAAFTEHGPDASLEDVARRAGVGIGTLYRHFPTRDALVEAAYRRGLETLCDQADVLAHELPPAEALEAWMLAFVGYAATKRGLGAVLKLAANKAVLFAEVRARIRTAMDGLVTSAVASGAIRPDANAADLLGAVSGVCMISDQPDWQDQSRRLVRLLMDGLRYGAPTPS
ncbi:TetR/AcrR family transcriptional regulator [Acidothermaceae bacterium B102]|nr:TetR/AcrR family transcriptional regulator [Acidothermaceae bacterium B102]